MNIKRWKVSKLKLTKEKIDSGIYLVSQLLCKALPFLIFPIIVSRIGIADIREVGDFFSFNYDLKTAFRVLFGRSINEALLQSNA